MLLNKLPEALEFSSLIFQNMPASKVSQWLVCKIVEAFHLFLSHIVDPIVKAFPFLQSWPV